ncbi:MAG: ABC transporter substrate-binding protein [Actinomycetes bacterium]|jgi:peptide/nickel transport system substrate-binding protein|nr:ABC transporter substrate-binding protein [Actinomycetes bacterium]
MHTKGKSLDWRNRKWLIVLAVLAAVVLAATLVGCGGAKTDGADSGTDSAAVDDTLRIALNADVVKLDPAFGYDWTTCPVLANIYEGILKYDNDNQLQVDLAESWEQVDDLTYKYVMRSDVKFSDGTPMTMEDVMYSMERIRSDELSSYVQWMYANVDSIEQTGDWEFTVKLTQADALWKHTFATTGGMIVQKAYVEEKGEEFGTNNGKSLGTGPYVLDTWTAGSEIVLKYNPDWWGAASQGEPDVKTIDFQVITEDATRVMASTSGQVDIDFVTPAEKLDEVKAADSVNLTLIPAAGLNFIAFNCQKAPFDDPNVRKAIASAIDIKTQQENAIKEYGNLTNYIPTPDSLYLFSENVYKDFEASAPKYEYDMAAAKDYLSKSKVPNGFECTIKIEGNSLNSTLALAWQQSLKELGITMNIEKIGWDELVSTAFGAGSVDGIRDYDMLMCEWSSDFPDPSGVLTPIYDSANIPEGGSNFAAYDNPEVDKLLKSQAALPDGDERAQQMTEMMALAGEDVPYYIWTHQNWRFTSSKRIKEGVTNWSNMWIWNAYVKDIKL